MLTELPEFRAPGEATMKGHREWSGFLTIENAEHVAACIREMLVGQRFVWAEYNEGLPGLGLRVDTGRYLTENTSDASGISCRVEGYAHIIVCDSYGVWGLTSDLATQPPLMLKRDEDPELFDLAKRTPYVAFGRSASLSTWGLHIEQRVPAGHLTRWTVAVEGQN